MLADTAGIVATDDVVERIGVERSRASLAAARLVILVLDSSVPLRPEDRSLIGEVSRAREADPDQRTIIALNKADKSRSLLPKDVEGLLQDCPVVLTSALAGDGLQALRAEIGRMLLQNGLPGESAVVTSLRHQAVLQEAHVALMEAQQAAADRLPEDFVCIGLRAAINAVRRANG